MRAPVSLCVIVKNQPLLADCLLSFREHVKEIVVVDNGCTDQATLNAIGQYANIHQTYTDCNNKKTGMIEDFSKLRQRSFDLATQPWVIWADADDKVLGADKLLQLTQSYTGTVPICYSFPYELYDGNGQCSLRFYRERLFFQPKAWRWTNPVHEVVIPSQDNLREDLLFRHQRQVIQEPGRNLRILLQHYKKVGEAISPRMRFYLGSECADNQLWDEAIKHLTKYIYTGAWEDEQVMACLRLVSIYQDRKDWTSAFKWSFKAIELKENWAEGYWALAKTFYLRAYNQDNRRDWEKCVYHIRHGLSLPPTITKLFINPMERECEIHKYLNFALNKIGDVQGALQSVLIGMRKQPNNSMFVQNKLIYEQHLAKTNLVQISQSP